jgi:hypothetical protein
MLQREERLKIIQAEIDRCTSEIHSLGCDEFDAQEPRKKRRADTLNLVIDELNAIKIDGQVSVILQPVLDSAKDTFIEPLQNIIQLDFKKTDNWGTLKEILNSLYGKMDLLTMFPYKKLNQLFLGIRKGIVDKMPNFDQITSEVDREASFKAMLHTIGETMKAGYASYSEGLPPSVTTHIMKIQDALINA